MRCEKVLTSFEMARVEGLAIQEQGEGSSERYMETAGRGLAFKIKEFLQQRGLQKARLLLLCGPGNNGGDAFVAGVHLLKEGHWVQAVSLDAQGKKSPLCSKNLTRFKEAGGKVTEEYKTLESSFTLILDGLFGTGFKGYASDSYQNLIHWVNERKSSVFSIDIPSGLSEQSLDSRDKNKLIIKATKTFYLGFSKRHFFFKKALDYCGELERVSFGLEKNYEEMASSDSYLLTEKSFSKLDLPQLMKTSHKHSSGKCALWAGSETMLGASILASKAAYRAGSGYVRLFLSTKEKSLLNSVPELILENFSLEGSSKKILSDLEAMKNSDACLIGPGIGLAKKNQTLLEKLCQKISVPLVLDADALTHYAKREFLLPKQVILSPHLGELGRLLGLPKTPKMTESLLRKVKLYAQRRNVTMIVKGSPSFIVNKDHPVTLYAGGDPGMGTAGSGDVLSGILTAFLARGMSSYEAACLGVWCHGEAGKLVAKEKSSLSLVASDLIEALPRVFVSLLQREE